jgi:endogenous inhibitor of DNA gyrase (YacG/DUF329 family)
VSDERKAKCAMCRKPIALRPHNEDFPFCSEQCRMQDLGHWLNEAYAIPLGQSATERSLPRDGE